eukprot:26125_5
MGATRTGSTRPQFAPILRMLVFSSHPARASRIGAASTAMRSRMQKPTACGCCTRMRKLV